MPSGLEGYNHRDLYEYLEPLLSLGPAALEDGNCMFDSLCILLSRNNILRADGDAWNVPNMRVAAVEAARREWELAQRDDKQKQKLEGTLMSIIELHRKTAGSRVMDIESYFQQMQVPCNAAQFNVEVPRGLQGIWGDSHMLHCLADALGIVVVVMTASPTCEACIYGPKDQSTSNQAPQCIVYLQHDGLSHYGTLVPTHGDAADTLVKQAMASALPELTQKGAKRRLARMPLTARKTRHSEQKRRMS